MILDVVYNHLGPAGQLPRRSFGPYFTDRHTTPWGDAVNLDGAGSDEVRRFFIDNAIMWLRDYHFDGLRLDAVHAIVDTLGAPLPRAAGAEVDALEAMLGRHVVLDRRERPRTTRAGALHATPPASASTRNGATTSTMRSTACSPASAAATTRTSAALDAPGAGVIAQGFVYAGRHSPHRGRAHGRPPATCPAGGFVVSTQNHDQVGNRAMGERLAHLARPAGCASPRRCS